MVSADETPEAGRMVTFLELEGTKFDAGVKSIGNVSAVEPLYVVCNSKTILLV